MKRKISVILISSAYLISLITNPVMALDNNEIASEVLQPATKAVANKGQVEQILKNGLKNPLFSSGYGISVRDLTDGQIIYEENSEESMMPASLTKIYTAASASLQLDPDARFVTRTKFLNNKVYLVGGGDPQLGTDSNSKIADLEDLAIQTAQKLKTFNAYQVSVVVDDSALGALQRPKDWLDTYFITSEIHLISALNLDDPVAPKQAPTDPSIATGKTFSAYLAKYGIIVNEEVTRAQAPKESFEIGVEYSKSVSQLIEDTLLISNNQDAEIISRVAAAIAKGNPSTTSATDLVLADVEKLGVSSVDSILADTSGLSRSNRISPSDLSEVIYRTIKNPPITVEAKGDITKFLITPTVPIAPDPWSVFTGLPTAHGLGTMKKRFNEKNSPGRGVIRAKTGTLNEVITLAGTLTTKDNVNLSFAILVEKVNEPKKVREALDQLLNGLATCNCAISEE